MFTGDGGTTTKHTDWMAEKGKAWNNNPRNKGFIISRDGWKSLNTQLKPKLEYGLVAVCVPPKTLEDLMSKIQHTALGLLVFNQKIYTELRTAHVRYQGMGIFDLNNSCMEFQVHLMREYWNKDNCFGNMMKLAYKTCLVDTELGGNVFSRDYKKLHRLVEKN